MNAVHHVDGNPYNNSPDNLAVLDIETQLYGGHMGGLEKYVELPKGPSSDVFGQFQDKITQLIYTNHWGSWQFNVDYHVMTLRVSCEHGVPLEHSITQAALTQCVDGNVVAEMIFWELKKQCAQHPPKLPKLPNGKFLYSLASPEPVAYQTYGGQVFDMETLKNSYEDLQAVIQAEVLKQMTSPFGGAFVAGDQSGGGNGALGALSRIVPNVTAALANCPACSLKQRVLANMVMHLNDQHKWTREAIADWLDTLDIDLTVKPVEKGNEIAQPRTSSDEAILKAYTTFKESGWFPGGTIPDVALAE